MQAGRAPLLAALAVLAALPALAVADPPRVWGVADALTKLRPGAPLPAGTAIDLAAPRGGCDTAQIAVKGPAHLSALSAEAGPLRPPRGASGPGIAPALARVATVELAKPSGPEGAAGAWPDPLIPVRDAYYGEARRAFPVEVPAGRLQSIWVDVCVPAGAAPGRWTGTVRLRERGRPLGEVAVGLTVWPFDLPDSGAFVVTFGLPTRLATQVLGRPGDADLARAFAAALLRNRISPEGLSYDPPWGRCTAERCALDWTPYDAEMAPILDGTLVPGRRGRFADVRITGEDWARSEADVTALLRAWREHFERKGWADALWLYTLDEPKPEDLPELARRARAAHAAGVRVFVTSVPRPELAGLVDAWAPNVLFFDAPGARERFLARRAPVAGGRGARAPDAPGAAREAGAPFWYASCMSHGCDELPAAGAQRTAMQRTFRGWPGYEIDRPGAAVRAMGWLAEREGVRGELYYMTLEGWDRRDPWTDVRAFAGNGDGLLLYPGRPERLGGTHPFPVESIRLALVRGAVEDRELLRLARAHGLGALADRLLDRVAPGLRTFSRDGAALVAARRELGEALARSLGPSPHPATAPATARSP